MVQSQTRHCRRGRGKSLWWTVAAADARAAVAVGTLPASWLRLVAPTHRWKAPRRPLGPAVAMAPNAARAP